MAELLTRRPLITSITLLKSLRLTANRAARTISCAVLAILIRQLRKTSLIRALTVITDQMGAHLREAHSYLWDRKAADKRCLLELMEVQAQQLTTL